MSHLERPTVNSASSSHRASNIWTSCRLPASQWSLESHWIRERECHQRWRQTAAKDGVWRPMGVFVLQLYREPEVWGSFHRGGKDGRLYKTAPGTWRGSVFRNYFFCFVCVVAASNLFLFFMWVVKLSRLFLRRDTSLFILLWFQSHPSSWIPQTNLVSKKKLLLTRLRSPAKTMREENLLLKPQAPQTERFHMSLHLIRKQSRAPASLSSLCPLDQTSEVITELAGGLQDVHQRAISTLCPASWCLDPSRPLRWLQHLRAQSAMQVNCHRSSVW